MTRAVRRLQQLMDKAQKRLSIKIYENKKTLNVLMLFLTGLTVEKKAVS